MSNLEATFSPFSRFLVRPIIPVATFEISNELVISSKLGKVGTSLKGLIG